MITPDTDIPAHLRGNELFSVVSIQAGDGFALMHLVGELNKATDPQVAAALMSLTGARVKLLFSINGISPEASCRLEEAFLPLVKRKDLTRDMLMQVLVAPTQ